MKKHLFVALSLMVAVSCSVKEPAVPEESSDSCKILSVGIADGSAKTALGEKSDDAYPVIWKAGDVISVNGVSSQPLTADSEPGASAQFTLPGSVSAPYSVLSPASALEQGGTVTIPAVQAYVSGQYDPAAAILAGRSESDLILLKAAVAFVRINLQQGGSEALKEIKIFSGDGEALSGTFSVNFSDASLELRGDAWSSVSMDSSNGLAYDNYGKASAVITIPAGTYAKGFAVEVTAQNGDHMGRTAYASSGITVAAGTLVNMPEFTFAASSSQFSGGSGTAGDPFRIATADDLCRLSELCSSTSASDYLGKSYIQVADIDMGAVSKFAPISNANNVFTGVYDGGNHGIANLKMNPTADNGALFGYLKGSGAKLCNIKLVNATITSSGTNTAGIVGFGYQGAIDNCHLIGCSITGTSGTGGIVGRPYKINMTNCSSDVSTTVSGTADIGGLIGGGTSFNNSDAMSVSNCTNYATVISSGNFAGGILGGGMTMKKASKVTITGCTSYGEVRCGGRNAGGIVGGLDCGTGTSASTTTFLAIDKCVSYASVKGTFAVAGIVGYAYATGTGVTLVTNSSYFGGTLEATENGGNPKYSATGGVFGFNRQGDGSLRIINCVTMIDKIYAHTTDPVSFGVAGIVGYTSVADTNSKGPLEIAGCYSTFAKSDFYIDGTPSTTETINYGGIYGLFSSTASASTANISNCWYCEDIGQAGPNTYARKTDTAAQYDDLTTLLGDLNAFASSYSVSGVELLAWEPDGNGYPVLSGTSSNVQEEITIGGSTENPGNSGAEGGNIEVPGRDNPVNW